MFWGGTYRTTETRERGGEGERGRVGGEERERDRGKEKERKGREKE